VGSEIHINSHIPDDQQQVRVAMGPGGQSVAVWMSYSQVADGTGELFGQLLDATGALVGGEFQISNIAAVSFPRVHFDVAMADDGSFVVVWSAYSASNAVYARRYDASGAAQGAQITVSNDSDQWTDHEVSVAMHGDGAFAVLFDWESGFTVGGRLQAYSAEGIELTVEAEWVSDLRRTYELDLAALSGGGYVSCWRAFDTDTEVFCRLADSFGVASSNEIPINTTTDGTQDYPQIAALSDGGFVVVWRTWGFDVDDFVGVRMFDSNGDPTTDELVATDATSDFVEDPAVAAGDSGFLVVWHGWQEDYPSEVWGRVFGNDGTPASEVFLINTFTSGMQTAPHAAAAASGLGLVAWQDWAQEGETFTDENPGIGIYGQLIQLPASP
jgi:hypothetical protein